MTGKLHNPASQKRTVRNPSYRLPLTSLLALVYVISLPLDAIQFLPGRSLPSVVAIVFVLVVLFERFGSKSPTISIDNQSHARPGLLWWSLVALLAWETVTIFWTIDVPNSFVKLTSEAVLLAFSPLLARHLSLAARLPISAFVWSSTVLAILTVASPASIETGLRQTALSQNQNGTALILALAFQWCFVLVAQAPWGVMQVLRILSIPVLAWGTLATGSRTGLVALPIAALVGVLVVASKSRRPVLSGAFGIAIIVMGVSVVLSNLERFSPRLLTMSSQLSSLTVDDRQPIWSSLIERRDEWLLLGKGIGASQAFLSVDTRSLSAAHNTFLGVAVETGILGMALLTLVCIATLVVGWYSTLRLYVMSGLLILLPFLLTLSLEYSKILWLVFALAAVRSGTIRYDSRAIRVPT